MRFAAQTHLGQSILYFDILEAWSQSTSSFERFYADTFRLRFAGSMRSSLLTFTFSGTTKLGLLAVRKEDLRPFKS